jgi:hypothetical protein
MAPVRRELHTSRGNAYPYNSLTRPPFNRATISRKDAKNDNPPSYLPPKEEGPGERGVVRTDYGVKPPLPFTINYSLLTIN